MKIAVIGAYGAGKTTLLTACTNAALPDPLPVPRVSPMRDPAGASPKALEEATDPELIQLVVRRYTERAVAESEHRSGFVSDGSLLHEWVYATVRLAVGLHPGAGTELDVARSRRSNPCAEVVAQIGQEAVRRACATYDAFLHLPVEFPLNDAVKPISERFRVLSDQFLLDSLHQLGATVHTLGGTLPQRVHGLAQLAGHRASLAPGLSQKIPSDL